MERTKRWWREGKCCGFAHEKSVLSDSWRELTQEVISFQFLEGVLKMLENHLLVVIFTELDSKLVKWISVSLTYLSSYDFIRILKTDHCVLLFYGPLRYFYSCSDLTRRSISTCSWLAIKMTLLVNKAKKQIPLAGFIMHMSTWFRNLATRNK